MLVVDEKTVRILEAIMSYESIDSFDLEEKCGIKRVILRRRVNELIKYNLIAKKRGSLDYVIKDIEKCIWQTYIARNPSEFIFRSYSSSVSFLKIIETLSKNEIISGPYALECVMKNISSDQIYIYSKSIELTIEKLNLLNAVEELEKEQGNIKLFEYKPYMNVGVSIDFLATKKENRPHLAHTSHIILDNLHIKGRHSEIARELLNRLI